MFHAGRLAAPGSRVESVVAPRHLVMGFLETQARSLSEQPTNRYSAQPVRELSGLSDPLGQGQACRQLNLCGIDIPHADLIQLSQLVRQVRPADDSVSAPPGPAAKSQT